MNYSVLFNQKRCCGEILSPALALIHHLIKFLHFFMAESNCLDPQYSHRVTFFCLSVLAENNRVVHIEITSFTSISKCFTIFYSTSVETGCVLVVVLIRKQ